MGMFDRVICTASLPPVVIGGAKVNFTDVEFQTKDLDRCMRLYEIDNDGLYTNDTNINYHGDVTFYSLQSFPDIPDTSFLISFKARFDYGNLAYIEHSGVEKVVHTKFEDTLQRIHDSTK